MWQVESQKINMEGCVKHTSKTPVCLLGAQAGCGG